MPTRQTQQFGRILAALMILFAAMFYGFVTASGNGINVYTAGSQDFTTSFPAWNTSGATFNGTTTNPDNQLVIETVENGTYTYTSPVIDRQQLLKVTDLQYRADLGKTGGITVKVFTSDDGFTTVENVDTFQLEDGVRTRVVDLPRSQDYRFQALLSYESGGTSSEPVLESLTLNGLSYEREYDFSFIFKFVMFVLLVFMAVLAAVPFD